MKQRWQPWLLGLLLIPGCTGEPGAPRGGGLDPTLINGDAGFVCAHPEEGCPCDTGQPPIDCYLDAHVDDAGAVTCSRGTRYCRGGAWSGCDSVETYQLRSGPGIAALVTGPTSCNPCNPACAVSRDTPSTADLPGSSTGVEYDPLRGGITLLADAAPSTPALPDTDGDGVPDIADECVGPGAFRAADGSCYGDTFFFHTLPYGGPAVIDPLAVAVQVRTADIYFLMDTTGSMGGAISNLRSSLTSGTFIPGCSGGIIGAIRCTIPDAWFGVGFFDDYPVPDYGGAGDFVYRNLQDISSSVSAAQTAVNALTLHWGNDGPESQSQALWAVSSGGGLGPYLDPRVGCPLGTWGYPCFRAGTIPITVMFTDAPFHNGPFGYDYDFTGASALPPPTPVAGSGGTSLPVATPVPSPSAAPSTTAVTGNETIATARYTGNAATTWTQWSGNTCVMANDYSSTGCGTSTSRDAVFRFDLSVAATIRISLEGSSYDTVLSLRNSAGTQITCNDDAVGLQSVLTPTLAAGTYYVVVEGYGTACGNYLLGIGVPAASGSSSNDTMATARYTGDAATTWTGWSGNTCGFADNTAASCAYNVSRDVVFRFDVSVRRSILFTLEGSTFDTVMSIRNSAGTGELACNDDWVGLQSQITLTLDPGTYFVIVEGYGADCGNYRLSLGVPPPPSGDTIATAWYTGDAATTWTSWSGNTCSPMRNDYTAGCAFNDSTDGVFRFDVSTRSTIRLTTAGSSFDTVLSLRNSAGTEIACNDDAVGLQSVINVTLDPGTYYAVLMGYSTACGSFQFTIGVPPVIAGPTGYPVTWAQTVTELNRTGMRVLTVQNGGGYGIDDANALADATGSYSSSGARYVFPINWDGTGLSAAVVDAVRDLANYNRMDITARATDNIATPGTDERRFVQSITAVSWGPGSCSGISGGSTFVQCLPGTNVDFNIAFQNDFVMPMAVPQVFDFFIEVVGDGTFVLERIPVRIVVPPTVALYPASGSYWRDYDATLFCTRTEAPDWNNLTWDAPSIPPGTSIRWEIRSARTAAGVATATPVTFTTPPTVSPVDVGARLVAAGLPNGMPYLRVTAVLLANADRTQAPVLRSFELRYNCIPTE